MEVRSVHHVAFAVEDLDAAVATYQRLFGARIELRGRMDDQGVEAAYLRIGDGRIELVSALGEDTPVGRFLAKRGPGMHHVAYEVEDIDAALEQCRTVSEAATRLRRDGSALVSFETPDGEVQAFDLRLGGRR